MVRIPISPFGRPALGLPIVKPRSNQHSRRWHIAGLIVAPSNHRRHDIDLANTSLLEDKRSLPR